MKRAILVSLIVALAAPAAWAQRSGGRFGGSRSFSRSSSSSRSYGGGSSYRSSSSSYRSSSSSSSYARSSSYASSPNYGTTARLLVPSIQMGLAIPGTSLFVRTADQQPRATDDERAARSLWQPFDTVTYQGPPEVAPGLVAYTASFAVLGGLSLLLTRRRMPGSSLARNVTKPFGARGVCEVRRVSLGFDWTARARLQQQLDGIASAFDFSTPHGLHAGAVRAQALLIEAVAGARYAAFQSFVGLEAREAEQKFASLADDSRGRYSVETVSNARRIAPPDVTASAEEGRGLVVVTMITGTTQPLPPMPTVLDRNAALQSLRAMLPAGVDDLVGLEVVWSPAVDSDRMSSAELEVIYPELVRIDASGSLGRIACSYCHAIHAGELARCPACGARRE